MDYITGPAAAIWDWAGDAFNWTGDYVLTLLPEGEEPFGNMATYGARVGMNVLWIVIV